MKVVTLLISWSLPLLQAGGSAQSPSRGDVPHAEAHATPVVMQQAWDAVFLDDPCRGSLGESLWDEEEESLEDILFDTGLLLAWSRRRDGLDDASSLAHSSLDLLRTPSHPHPLRC